MKRETFAAPEYKEGLEADAVCGQCGNVNPEGTLICKTCGNNLRDQRMLRMAADQILDTEKETAQRPSFLIRALPVLAILIILWLGLNVGNISNVLTSAENTSGGADTIYADPEQFWTGSDSGTYNTLYANLTVRFPSASDAESARLNTSPQDGFMDGKYVLFERMGTGLRYAGAVAVRAERDTWRYNASLLDGVEIRGIASVFNQMLTSQWDQAGALYQNEYYAVTGNALAQPDGSISINGESSHSMRRFSGVAYRYSGL